MPDDRTPAQRSETMRRIRSRDTSCELALRAELRRRGLRLAQRRRVPGSPDAIVLRPGAPRGAPGVAVFVDGCFWHGCPMHCRLPAANRPYWEAKIARNMARDRAASSRLRREGWAVVRIWEHAVRNGLAACGARVERAANRPIRRT